MSTKKAKARKRRKQAADHKAWASTKFKAVGLSLDPLSAENCQSRDVVMRMTMGQSQIAV